ncbi:single-stranded DNA-binding protein [Erysipelothrix amsterdamensis]|uniref:Single-stranded DNA-binding protein n=1 Tax=Erysipelothrix amsterdamensis TaxID=2929157 RepID=A0AAU9VIN7_9FIRM|nr:single-stranded DNA-binding protein [Erysipelothrix rhusiopathiae]CAH2762071.1 single-stranded DNA-binding protein [Erysipelothrix sp. A18Y020d]MCG4457663.1 single-stranded DNA-binding protein [Erysipelothrix rhusiopathiae]MDE8061316.1 single-stranded DNA-binding protein [Erysipelothrix rhusiopathiae]MDE8220841.1 single-stranded DNA-binding protein [Erysipelothrix rhusiopathiae]MDE8276735.1 single-stranded DNA-binding protein [Erysipelothrix rhusiopathiae]
MNKVIITGTLHGQLVKNEIGEGKSKLLFTIISRNDYPNREGIYENTFINCVAWNETAGFILRNFKSGDSIEAIGSIINETWEKDGVKQYKDRIHIKDVGFVPVKLKSQTE